MSTIEEWMRHIPTYATIYTYSKHIALRPTFPLFVQTNRNPPPFLFLMTKRVLPLKGSHFAINACRQTIHFTSFPFIMKIARRVLPGRSLGKAYETWPTLEATRFQAKRLLENEDPRCGTNRRPSKSLCLSGSYSAQVSV